MNVWIPKELMENELYSKMSNGAKVLYGILANLKKDAEKNEWIDERGCRYVLLPKKRMQEELNCSRYSADLFMKELEVLDLIRLGYCITPIIQRRIYVRNLEDVDAGAILTRHMQKGEKAEESPGPAEQDPQVAERKKDPAKEAEEETVKEILNLVEALTDLLSRAFGDDEIEKA